MSTHRIEWDGDHFVRIWDGETKLVALGGSDDMDKQAILTAAYARLANTTDAPVDLGGVTIMPDGELRIALPVAMLEAGATKARVKP